MALINLNDTTPSAPSGRQNIAWLADSSDPRNVSANIPQAFYTITWGLGVGGGLVTGADMTPHYVVPAAGSLAHVTVTAKTAPTGADLILDILDNGTSIFGSSKLHLTAGATYVLAASTVFAASPQHVAAGDILTISVVQVGSTAAGQDVLVQLLVNPS